MREISYELFVGLSTGVNCVPLDDIDQLAVTVARVRVRGSVKHTAS